MTSPSSSSVISSRSQPLSSFLFHHLQSHRRTIPVPHIQGRRKRLHLILLSREQQEEPSLVRKRLCSWASDQPGQDFLELSSSLRFFRPKSSFLSSLLQQVSGLPCCLKALLTNLCSSALYSPKVSCQDFPDGAVVKTPCSQCRQSTLTPWSGNQIPHAAPKSQHSKINESMFVCLF